MIIIFFLLLLSYWISLVKTSAILFFCWFICFISRSCLFGNRLSWAKLIHGTLILFPFIETWDSNFFQIFRFQLAAVLPSKCVRRSLFCLKRIFGQLIRCHWFSSFAFAYHYSSLIIIAGAALFTHIVCNML